MFIDNSSASSYLPAIADGDSAATGRSRPPEAPRTRNDPIDQNDKRDQAMTAFRNLAVTVAFTGVLGFVLFTITDFATRGVIA